MNGLELDCGDLVLFTELRFCPRSTYQLSFDAFIYFYICGWVEMEFNTDKKKKWSSRCVDG